jgi:hypothetical protein
VLNFLPPFRSGYLGDLPTPLRCKPITPRRTTLSAERLGGLVLARIAHVFFDLAGQNLGNADRVGVGIGWAFLALRSLGHSGSDSVLYAKHMCLRERNAIAISMDTDAYGRDDAASLVIHNEESILRRVNAGGGNIMAARKSVLKPAPRRPELDRLMDASIKAGVTDEVLREQRISFVYGNAPEGSRITKASARKAASGIRLT